MNTGRLALGPLHIISNVLGRRDPAAKDQHVLPTVTFRDGPIDSLYRAWPVSRAVSRRSWGDCGWCSKRQGHRETPTHLCRSHLNSWGDTIGHMSWVESAFPSSQPPAWPCCLTGQWRLSPGAEALCLPGWVLTVSTVPMSPPAPPPVNSLPQSHEGEESSRLRWDKGAARPGDTWRAAPSEWLAGCEGRRCLIVPSFWKSRESDSDMNADGR